MHMRRFRVWLDAQRARVLAGLFGSAERLFGLRIGERRDRPALLVHDDVIALFHEFGHAVHHLLTQVHYPSIAGINGFASDPVERPSQFLENFAWHPDVIEGLAAHWQTGEPLSGELRAQLIVTQKFHAALDMMRQLECALFDLRLHAEFDLAGGRRGAAEAFLEFRGLPPEVEALLRHDGIAA